MSENVEQVPGMRRGLRWLLIGSLACNLLIVGAVVGMVVAHSLRDDHRPPRFDRAGGLMTKALSPQDRRTIGRELRRAYREKRPSFADVRTEYQAVIDALRATPYDPSVVRAAVERQIAAMQERGQTGKELLLARLAEMDDADRKAYADRLQDILEHGPQKERRRR
jgi:uncharacterized membrane protein